MMKVMNKLKGMSLRWKLLIPFLFFAFSGTTIMAYIGLTSQIRLIQEEEKKAILQHYQLFLHEIRDKADQARALASTIAENPRVQRLLAERDRQGLLRLLAGTYERLREEFDLGFFHFHVPPATSFLRLHSPEMYGEEMEFRRTILDAVKLRRPVAGLEIGIMGFGIRGVAPVIHEGNIAGTVGIGLSFGESFMETVHREWDVAVALYQIRDREFVPIAEAGGGYRAYHLSDFTPLPSEEAPSIFIAPEKYPEKSFLFGPVRDYSGNTVAFIEISIDRSWIIQRLNRSRRLMITVGAAGIMVSFLLTIVVAYFFIKPIKEIVREAQDIAEEKRESRLEGRPGDEIGVLTRSLNQMLDALKKRRMEIENHARNLEKIVQERTADLVTTMENYRTLVENVPLIVYRLLQDGTTEFINGYLTESLGYEIEEAVGNRMFWREKICGNDPELFALLIETCFEKGKEFRIERSVRHKSGYLLTFIDHAIPSKDEDGRVRWVDGIMVDITELKRLQERALRTEEIRIMGELSARIAHEIRNPLAVAGGFARRLMAAIPESDPNHRLASIIVTEVARMEDFLKVLFASIRSFDLSLTEVHLNELLSGWTARLRDLIEARQIRVEEHFEKDIPPLQADYDRLSQAFFNILKHAVLSMPVGETLLLCTRRSGQNLCVTLKHKMERIADYDLEQFFFPHVEYDMESTVLDLPMSRIIIHRHGGKINLAREDRNFLAMMIEFPITTPAVGG